MLIGENTSAFDDERFIFETKWDGERCIAYLDPKLGTELRNKRNVKMLSKVPELSEIHKQVKKRCILDGELMVLKNGKPDFYEIQKRSLMSNQFRIQLASKQYPATFIAFDILYVDDKDITLQTLTERKSALKKCFKAESGRMAMSRYIEKNGISLYNIAEQQCLEGIVAKRKDSIYIQGKRTKDWIKIKNMKDEDFVVCGYIYKDNHMISIVLGQYDDSQLVYKGHVTLGVGGENFKKIKSVKGIPESYFQVPEGNEDAIWIMPELVCVVQFMDYTAGGGMRQPVFKGLRPDKRPEECQLKNNMGGD